MTRARSIPERVRAVLDALTERIDAEALGVGADAPHLVATVGSFHAAAGHLERRLERRPYLTATDAAIVLRQLRRVVAAHATMRRLQAIRRGRR